MKKIYSMWQMLVPSIQLFPVQHHHHMDVSPKTRPYPALIRFPILTVFTLSTLRCKTVVLHASSWRYTHITSTFRPLPCNHVGRLLLVADICRLQSLSAASLMVYSLSTITEIYGGKQPTQAALTDQSSQGPRICNSAAG